MDYPLARAAIFRLICSRKGHNGWTTYWNSIRNFILGYISKSEMENIVFSIIDQSEIPIHNTYILSILHNINVSVLVQDDIIGLDQIQ